MPGSCTSMPKSGLPVTLSGMSRRGAGLPMRFQSLGSLSFTSPEGSSLEAAWASWPNRSLLRDGLWMTTPFSASHSDPGTFHLCAAAATSISRPVELPCPISERATRITTLLSGLMTIQAVNSGPFPFAAAWASTGAGIASWSARPPPTAVETLRKSRRDWRNGVVMVFAERSILRFGLSGSPQIPPLPCFKSGRRSLFRSVLTKSAIYSFRIGEKFVQIRVNKNDIRAFAIALRVLAADTRSDQVLRIFVSKGIFITVHRLSVLAVSFVVPKSSECDHYAQYRIPPGTCHPSTLQRSSTYPHRRSGRGHEPPRNDHRQIPRMLRRTRHHACSRSMWLSPDPIRSPCRRFLGQPYSAIPPVPPATCNP